MEYTRKLSTSTAHIMEQFKRSAGPAQVYGHVALDGFAAPEPYTPSAAMQHSSSSSDDEDEDEPAAATARAAPPPLPPPATSAAAATTAAAAAAAAAPAKQALTPHGAGTAGLPASVALHQRLAAAAAAQEGWGEAAATALAGLIEPTVRSNGEDAGDDAASDGADAVLCMGDLPSDEEYSGAMGVGVNQVLGKLRLLALVAGAPAAVREDSRVVNPAAVYVAQLGALRDELATELAQFLSDAPAMCARPEVFGALASCVRALLQQRGAVQRAAAKSGGPSIQELMMMDDCCGSVMFNNEQWEAAEAQYALLDSMLQAEVGGAAKEAAVGGAGGAPLVAQLLVLLDSGDDRERECLSEMLGMMWAEGLFRGALITQTHDALWAFVFDDRGKEWCRGSQYVYRLLQVLCSCLDEGGLEPAQYDAVFRLMAPLHVPEQLPDYHAQLKRAMRLLVRLEVEYDDDDDDDDDDDAAAAAAAAAGGDGAAASGEGDGATGLAGGVVVMRGMARMSRNGRLSAMVCALCKRWPLSGTGKQITLLGEVEELFLTCAEWPIGNSGNRGALIEALSPCFMPWSRVVCRGLCGGLQLMSRSLELVDQHSIAVGQVMHEVFLSDEPSLKHLIDTVGHLAGNHFSNDIKPQMADIWGRLKHMHRHRFSSS